jgi:hypothetical protein
MADRARALPYDEDLAQRVLDRIAAGELLRDLWRDPAMPTRGDLKRWRQADPSFEDQLRAVVNRARARRMTTYDADVADEICEGLCEGLSLRQICADPAMPSLTTVYLWLHERVEFRRNIANARELQGDRLADQVLEIAESATRETLPTARLQVAALRWRVGKLSAPKYGVG